MSTICHLTIELFEIVEEHILSSPRKKTLLKVMQEGERIVCIAF